MEVKKKDMKKTGWKRSLSKNYISEKIAINDINGVASLSLWKKISEPLIIHYSFKDTLIADDNFKWLQIALENQNFWLTAMYDNNDELVEIYFDITASNHFEDLDNPYFYDLFTDIVITNDGDVHIVDEDELDKAMEEKVISSEQYNLAKYTTKKLFDYIVNNKKSIIDYCYKKMKEFKNKRSDIMDLNGYKLIPATEQDYEFVYDLKKNAYMKYVEANWGAWDEDAQRGYFKKFIETYKDNIYLIKLEEKTIGFYSDEFFENGDYEVGNICIIPEYQGKGIGTQILNGILELYKDRDIHIQYFKQNPVGNLYARLGFEPNGETAFHYQMKKCAEKKLKK